VRLSFQPRLKRSDKKPALTSDSISELEVMRWPRGLSRNDSSVFTGSEKKKKKKKKNKKKKRHLKTGQCAYGNSLFGLDAHAQ